MWRSNYVTILSIGPLIHDSQVIEYYTAFKVPIVLKDNPILTTTYVLLDHLFVCPEQAQDKNRVTCDFKKNMVKVNWERGNKLSHLSIITICRPAIHFYYGIIVPSTQ